jgi:D-proline reductase (dithiol) PrdB
MSRQPPIDYIDRTQKQYEALGYPSYQWVHNDSAIPLAPLKKPVSEAKLSLIASGGLYTRGQVAFHYKDDLSYREIDAFGPIADLRATHFAYDLAPVRADPNVVFPVEPLKQLVATGVLGALAERAYTFMGGIYSARKVKEILAPAIAERLLADQTDLALLVPA